MAYTNGSLIKSVDWVTIAIYLALVVFGWFSICGACYDYGEMDLFSFDTNSGKQLVWIGGAFCLGFFILMLEDKIYDWFAYIFYAFMMVLLFVTPFLAEDIKGSYSWLKLGPVSLQPAEFAKFATALALAKFISSYGFVMGRLRSSIPVFSLVLLPMLLIILQRETGSALVYLAFFLMLYREGMPGSILFTGISVVVYFVVGIRFGQELLPDGCTCLGEFAVFSLITFLSALLVYAYCEQKNVFRNILVYNGGSIVLALLFSLYVIPFNLVYFLYVECAGLIVYLLYLSFHERVMRYFYIALFAVASVGFFYSADYVFEPVILW
mgnify:FL=1